MTTLLTRFLLTRKPKTTDKFFLYLRASEKVFQLLKFFIFYFFVQKRSAEHANELADPKNLF